MHAKFVELYRSCRHIVLPRYSAQAVGERKRKRTLTVLFQQELHKSRPPRLNHPSRSHLCAKPVNSAYVILFCELHGQQLKPSWFLMELRMAPWLWPEFLNACNLYFATALCPVWSGVALCHLCPTGSTGRCRNVYRIVTQLIQVRTSTATQGVGVGLCGIAQLACRQPSLQK